MILNEKYRRLLWNTFELSLFLTVSMLVIFVPQFILAQIERNRFRPPKGVDTFYEFIEQMPPPKLLTCFYTSEGWRIVWFGEEASSIAAPSGPSCYVFNDSGKLLMWNATTGDNEESTPYAKRAQGRENWAIEDVKKVIETQSQAK